MPDITLYRDDVLIIRDALNIARAELAYRYATQHSMTDYELAVLNNALRIDAILTDRVVQGLHPEREPRSVTN